MTLLAQRRVVVTGVLTTRSIAFAVAAALQREGADVILTGYGRGLPSTRRAAGRLPRAPRAVVEMDVTRAEDRAALARAVDEHWDGLDGLVHSIAFTPAAAIEGGFLDAPSDAAVAAIEASALSLHALSTALLTPLAAARGSIVAFDFDARRAWPGYDWQGVAKATLEAIGRYLALYLGPRGVRCNLVAAGPLHTAAARALPGHGRFIAAWDRQAPLGWSGHDRDAVADAAAFLLSPLARGVTGQILHVDGGVHAVGSALDDPRSPVSDRLT